MSKFHLVTDLQKVQVRLDIKRLIDENNVLKNQCEMNCTSEKYFVLELISQGQNFCPSRYSKVYAKNKLEIN